MITHAPLPLRDSPEEQGVQNPFTHGAGRLNAALCTGFGFRKGCNNDRELFFASDAFCLADDTLDDDDVDDGLDDGEPALATCEAEPLKLWLPAELAEKPEPPEEPPCEPPELDPPPPPPPPEACCARRVTETNRMAATTRLESRIKHLPPSEVSRAKS
ncbi:MAG: hypothetical protein WCA13_11885 [Terriglobales bacterium]